LIVSHSPPTLVTFFGPSHILHIELMNRLGARDGRGEHGADRGRLDHRAEGLIIVEAESLGEAAKNPVSLLPFHGAVKIELVLENLLVGDDIGANGARDKITGVADDQGSKFFFMARRQFGSKWAAQME
jgi:hypothetical protein